MENDPILDKVRNWFGLGKPEPGREQLDTFGGTSTPADLAQTLAAREVIEKISEFLLRNRIPINAESLAFAHDLVTNSDPRLAGLVKRRFRECRPIDAEWIAETRHVTKGDDPVSIARLRGRLEKSVTEFSQTTHDARTATSDYQNALQSHVDELHEVNKTGQVITELANVATAMLQRTSEIEERMARSERETRQLQRRIEEARRSAELDHLTGLPNRRAFEALLDREFLDARRTRDSLCVAFCDIDKFKTINDQHGHDAGDRVLRLVARTLSDISDDRCHVARHGGEEFVVLFRGKTTREAFEMLDGMRENLATRRLVNRATDAPFGQVSFSAGLADIFAYNNPRAALKAADEALYAAKEKGRNRITIASASGSPRAA